jgi:hypothetical protein
MHASTKFSFCISLTTVFLCVLSNTQPASAECSEVRPTQIDFSINSSNGKSMFRDLIVPEGKDGPRAILAPITALWAHVNATVGDNEGVAGPVQLIMTGPVEATFYAGTDEFGIGYFDLTAVVGSSRLPIG